SSLSSCERSRDKGIKESLLGGHPPLQMLHWASPFVDSGEHRTRPPSVQMDNRTRRRGSPNRLFAPPTFRLISLYHPHSCHRPHYLQRRRHPVRSRQSDTLGAQWAPSVRMEKLAVPGRQR